MDTKILLVEDHNIVRDGIKSLFKSVKGFQVLADLANGEAALAFLDKNPAVDIVVTDISMPKINGLQLTKAVKEKFPACKVLVLSMHNDEEYINQAVEAGADGYLLKDSEKDELIKAIEKIRNGEKYFSYNVSNIIISNMLNVEKKKNHASNYQLSEREKEVLKLIVEGLSNKLIASKLFVSTRTVDAHRYNIMQKMQVKNTAEMVRTAIQENLV
jgi:DNA-binding NarL/FixJ family response regulator